MFRQQRTITLTKHHEDWPMRGASPSKSLRRLRTYAVIEEAKANGDLDDFASYQVEKIRITSADDRAKDKSGDDVVQKAIHPIIKLGGAPRAKAGGGSSHDGRLLRLIKMPCIAR